MRLLLPALALACFLAAQGLAMHLHQRRPGANPDERLAEAYVAMEPGEFAGTLLLGGLRGLSGDLLWMQANRRREERRHSEAQALYRLINRVTPHDLLAWEYQSHDLAYNRVYETSDPDLGWAWFLAGVKVNAEGIRRNPLAARLSSHLAWIIFHKGEDFAGRILQADWSWLNPELATWGQALACGEATDLTTVRLPNGSGRRWLIFLAGRLIGQATTEADGRLVPKDPLPDLGPGQSWRWVESQTHYQLAERFYRCQMAIVEIRRSRGLTDRGSAHNPTNRRLISIGRERDAETLLRAGELRQGLEASLEALADWQVALAWHRAPATGLEERHVQLGEESYYRLEGRLRRRIAELAEAAVEDCELGRQLAAAVLLRHLAQARSLLAQARLRTPRQRPGVVWYDLPAEQGSSP